MDKKEDKKETTEEKKDEKQEEEKKEEKFDPFVGEWRKWKICMFLFEFAHKMAHFLWVKRS